MNEVMPLLLCCAKVAGFTTLVVMLDTFNTAYLPFAMGMGMQIGTSDPVFMHRRQPNSGGGLTTVTSETHSLFRTLIEQPHNVIFDEGGPLGTGLWENIVRDDIVSGCDDTDSSTVENMLPLSHKPVTRCTALQGVVHCSSSTLCLTGELDTDGILGQDRCATGRALVCMRQLTHVQLTPVHSIQLALHWCSQPRQQA